MHYFKSVFISSMFAIISQATVYEVGPGKALATIGEVPWATLEAGDTVLIYWQSTPYHEKWAIGRSGTATAPITVRGVPNSYGVRPVIDGENAITAPGLTYWNMDRGILKFGGTQVPNTDPQPQYIVIDGLTIQNARSSYTFEYHGSTIHYAGNAAAVYVERGSHITIKNCRMSNSSNGLFISGGSVQPNEDFLIQGNYFVDNGNAGSSQEHQSYTGAAGITFQYNWYSHMAANSDGNDLKDRSAGTVIRYNWFETANRQLDLVESTYAPINTDPRYHETFVYGNTFIEDQNLNNRQIVNYGGDGADTTIYRKGTLYFYNNTLVTHRLQTAVFRLGTPDEHVDCRNNILYTTSPGNSLLIVDNSGTVELHRNWMKAGWKVKDSGAGVVVDDGSTISTDSPGFMNEAGQDFRLTTTSPNRDAATALNPLVLPANDVLRQYLKHLSSTTRYRGLGLDVGAFE